MDVRTGSKSWGYSKRPRNWKKIMYQDLLEVDEIEEIPEVDEIEEVEEIPEVEEIIPKIPEKPPRIGRGLESEARIEKPKITARVSKPVLPVTLVDPVLPASLHDREEFPRPLVNPALLDSSFSHI